MTDKPVSERASVSELRKAHDAALTEWKTGGHGDRGYFKALDIAKILADRLEEAERLRAKNLNIAALSTDGAKIRVLAERAEKAEREAEVADERVASLERELREKDKLLMDMRLPRDTVED